MPTDKPVNYLRVAKNNLTMHDITPEQYMIRVATAQAAATVALVEAQETANLIAYQANVEASYARRAPGKPRSTDAVALNQTILERLGLS